MHRKEYEGTPQAYRLGQQPRTAVHCEQVRARPDSTARELGREGTPQAYRLGQRQRTAIHPARSRWH